MIKLAAFVFLLLYKVSYHSAGANLCSGFTCLGRGQMCKVINNQPICACKECDSFPEPVCGSDGDTYLNECLLNRRVCMTNMNIKLTDCNANKTNFEPCDGDENAVVPWIDIPRQNLFTLRTGQNLTIPCVAHGIPQPLVVWIDSQGVPVSSNPNDQVYSIDRNLKVQFATDEVEGEYKCVAINCASVRNINFSTLNSDSSMIIEIRYRSIKDCKDVAGMKALTHQFLTTVVTTSRGQSVTLTCDMKGVPKPKITWYKQDSGRNTMLMESSNLSIRGNVLKFMSAQIHDAGFYICSAVNCVSKKPTRAFFKLNVEQDMNRFVDNCLQMKWDSRAGEFCDDSMVRPYYAFDPLQRLCIQRTGPYCPGLKNAFTTLSQCSVECMTFCDLPVDAGTCTNRQIRYGWDSSNCVKFFYGGCGGNNNNFESRNLCRDTCQKRSFKIANHKRITDDFSLTLQIPASCPACNTTLLDSYCNHDFILVVRIRSTMEKLLNIGIEKVLHNTTDMSPFMDSSNNSILFVDNDISCKCPEVSFFSWPSRQSNELYLLTGMIIERSLHIVHGSLLKVFKGIYEQQVSLFTPSVCNIIRSWKNLDMKSLNASGIEVVPPEDFMKRFGL